MKPKARFIKSVIETARKCDTDLPWTRGNRRAATIARRTAPALRVKTA
ncbi:hypothetical protein [Primorskyibacter sp. S87]